jgi:hypothetical protein
MRRSRDMNISQKRIDDIFGLHGVVLSRKDVEATLEAVFNDGKLAGIRVLRERYNVGVLEAKNVLFTMLRSDNK